ncbi:MAG TPA: tetratricopeptide repeat protein, partial [Gemmataceae bacterium]|nr:tetratricopeptide repeat protein [Gemmataceae bacterium]
MLRILTVAVAGLSLTVVVRGDDPKPGTEPKPQWQRLLTGDDARKVAALEKRVEDRERADRYAEAVPIAEELLALRTRLQGADHWQTADQKWWLAELKKVAALPADKRLAWRKAAEGDAEGTRLLYKGQYATALPLKQERLRWCREVLGEAHPGTAAACNDVAYTLNAQEKFVEAGPLYQKALDIWREALGEDHPDTARGYNNVAYNLNCQAKYAEAEPLYRKALATWVRVLGEGHPETVNSYTNIAGNLHHQGKYAEAGPLYQKALDVSRKARGERHATTAMACNNLAVNLDAQGRHAEAGALLRKALDIRREVLGEDHPDT